MTTFVVTNTLDDLYSRAPEGSLRAALKQAKAGDTIKFKSNLKGKTIKLKRSFLIDKNITIDASSAPGLTLDGGRKHVIFSMESQGRSLKLKGLTLLNAAHQFNGGAIRATQPKSRIWVENSEFRNNVAGFGGAIWAKDQSEVTVLSSKFYGNRSTKANDTSAGAISVFSGSKLRVKDSKFVGNQGISGGAIGTIFSELTVENSIFRDNKSVRWSGAVHADGATIPQDPRYYSGNKPRAKVGKSIVIRNSQFYNNHSGGRGGAVGIWGYDQDYVRVSRSKFVGNRVTKDNKGIARGGALRISGKQVIVKDSHFANNASADEGGALWHQGESPATISNTTFLGNRAATAGGAIFNHQWKGPGTEIRSSSFKNNRASRGGAIYKNKPKKLVISSSLFQRNGTTPVDGNLTNYIRSSDGPGATPMSFTAPSRLVQLQSPTTLDTIVPVASQVTSDYIGSDSSLPTQSPSSLVAWLNFDQTDGSLIEDSAPGNKHAARRLLGNSWTKGVQGQAVSFEKGQSIVMKSSRDINLSTRNQRTVSFWFNAEDVSGKSRKQLLYKEGAGIRGLNVYLHDGALYAGGWNEPTSESSWGGTWLSSDDILSNKWHHVALVLDGEKTLRPNSLTAFVDGNRIGQGEGSQLWSHSGPISLGSIVGGTKFHDGTEPMKRNSFVGAMDEVKIFNSALSSEQVQQLATM